MKIVVLFREISPAIAPKNPLFSKKTGDKPKNVKKIQNFFIFLLTFDYKCNILS